jgi:hypothetical protein
VAPGLPHHVTQRGNRRQRTFFTDEDYAEYRRLLDDACHRCGTEVLAYSLMPNHVHLILVPADAFGLRVRSGKHPLLGPAVVIEPFAQAELAKASCHGQAVMLSMDQTDLGDRMALLMVALRVGDRALPLAWRAEEGAANIGFAGQQAVFEQILTWLPVGARVRLSADRFYPSAALFAWLQVQGWSYRLRLKGNVAGGYRRGR